MTTADTEPMSDDFEIRPVSRAAILSAISMAVAATLALALTTTSAHANPDVSFSFYGESDGGSASAVMDFYGLGSTTLKVELTNTSATTLLDGTGTNAPGITWFGFDLLPDYETNAPTSWALEAYNLSGDLIRIADSDSACSPTEGCDWFASFNQKITGTNVEYLLSNEGNGRANVQGAFYNEAALYTADAEEGLAAAPNFFTTAFLTLNFNSAVTKVNSAFVRMQNVGRNGEGSLKLPGDACCNQVPEPPTFTLALLGLSALGWRHHARRRGQALWLAADGPRPRSGA